MNLTATYDGKVFVPDVNVNFLPGQKFSLKPLNAETSKNAPIDFYKYAGSVSTFKNAEEIEEHIRSLRENDRI